MQRRHFELIAATLADIKALTGLTLTGRQHEIIVGLFADRLEDTNELFDAERFKAAAGVRKDANA